MEFLAYPLDSEHAIMQRFAELPDAIHVNEGNKKEFVFVKGNRSDRATLVAHADTVFFSVGEHAVTEENGVLWGERQNGTGLGADDRAGCAIVWLLKDMGHNLLITNGEERGQIGARFLMENYPEIAREINQSSYILQFDRRNATDYKCYYLPVTEAFCRYIENETGYHNAGQNSYTDIVALCKDVCGVNLSVGYYNEHWENEHLVLSEWRHTLDIATAMLKKPLKRYPLSINTNPEQV
jgi:hypothetical protein